MAVSGPGDPGPGDRGFVERLAHADDLAALEHDLVTALWEQDFAHIDYRVADPFLGGDVLREGMVDALRETILRRFEGTIAAPGAASGDPASGELRQVAADRIDAKILALSAEDIVRGESLVGTPPDTLNDADRTGGARSGPGGNGGRSEQSEGRPGVRCAFGPSQQVAGCGRTRPSGP